MSYARIIAELGDGRYTVELDWGQAQKDAYLNALIAVIGKAQLDLLQSEANLVEAEAVEAAARAAIASAIEDIIAIGVADPNMAGVAAAGGLETFEKLSRKYASVVAKNQPLRASIARLKLTLATAQKRYNRWFDFIATETRNAWCVDLTEGASGDVATVDVNGESNLILIAAGCRSWQDSDGVLRARELMSPEQAYFNAAILPGWQVDRPTYRWGTASNVDHEANTMDVALAPALSSAQRLDVNRSGSLVGVPVTYMTCNAKAFVDGDRVVVAFDGGDWAAPRVIGFVDNPKSCDVVAVTYRAVAHPTATGIIYQENLIVDDVVPAMTAPVIPEAYPLTVFNSWAVSNPDAVIGVPASSTSKDLPGWTVGSLPSGGALVSASALYGSVPPDPQTFILQVWTVTEMTPSQTAEIIDVDYVNGLNYWKVDLYAITSWVGQVQRALFPATPVTPPTLSYTTGLVHEGAGSMLFWLPVGAEVGDYTHLVTPHHDSNMPDLLVALPTLSYAATFGTTLRAVTCAANGLGGPQSRSYNPTSVDPKYPP